MSRPPHATYVEPGSEISLQFYHGEEPIAVRFVDANNLPAAQNAIRWILNGMTSQGVVGIDLEWVAENQVWEPVPTYHPISLIQIASEGRCVLLTTLGHLHPDPARFLRDFINSPTVCKAGVGNHTDKEKMQRDLGTDASPANWFDLQAHHAVKAMTTTPRLLGFNTLVDTLLVQHGKKSLVYPPAASYEAKQLTTFSNWNTPRLTLAQVAYAAFDAVAAKDMYLMLSKQCVVKECDFCYSREQHCRYCGVYFPVAGGLRDHLEEVHQLYACSLCDYCTADRKDIQSHRKKAHFSKRRVVCSSCSKVFRKESSLEAHQRDKKHGDWAITWQCDTCYQHFASLSALTHHEQTFCGSNDTTSTGPLCHYCGESFEEEDDLEEHNAYCFAREKATRMDGLPTPSQVRGGLGDRKSPKRFPKPRNWENRKIKLNRKERGAGAPFFPSAPSSPAVPAPSPHAQSQPSLVSVEKRVNLASALPFICETCGFLFGEQRFLDTHQQKAAHGRFQQKCAECGKVYRSVEALDSHQRSKRHDSIYY